MIKSALVLAQTNAESERSLSINARIVTQERASLGEKTIVGLHVLKDAVRFFDPVSNQPERIPITQDLKQSVKLAHSAYKECLEAEKREEAKRIEEAQKQKEMTEKEKREKERLIEKKESLAKTEEDLNEQESKARQELEAADELLNDATSKLQDALSSTTLSKNSVTVAKMMLETAKTKHKEALEQLDKIRKKQKTVDKKLMTCWIKLCLQKMSHKQKGKVRLRKSQ